MRPEQSLKRVPAGLPRTVIVLGFVSFFTDLSSEMIYPLLPAFLAGVLGAGAVSLGVVEGIAESTGALLKVLSGVWSDRFKKRKPMVLGGYGLSSIVRPLIGLAVSWPFVLAMRFADRIGKGVRTSPRDALLADATEPEIRGRAYGLHRAMDHAGAVLGPLAGAGLLALGLELRGVFLLAAVPGVVVVALILLGISEGGTSAAMLSSRPSEGDLSRLRDAHRSLQGGIRRIPGLESWRMMPREFRNLMHALLVFTLGNSTDAFLLLRLTEAGFQPSSVALFWSAHNVVRMTSSWYGGQLADRLGYRGMIAAGWLLYAMVYLAFGLMTSPVALVSIFMLYGLYFGLTEPAEKAWVSSLVSAGLRGTAFGFYHGTIGIAALPASIVFGILWKGFGAATAFCVGAGLAAAALVLLVRTRRRR